jgi:hypothetical protein
MIKPDNWSELPMYKKITYSLPFVTADQAKYADKIEVKELVKGKIETAKIVRILDGPEDVTSKDLNIDWIIKSSHACGQNIFALNDVEEIKKTLKLYNRTFSALGVDEPHYKFIKPRFFVEERIDDYQLGKYAQAITFQLYCIHGIPYTFSLLNTKQHRAKHYFVESGSIREMYPGKDPMYNFEIPNDSIIQEMLKLAGDLSQPFEFVRMDFYLSCDQKIYLSEFTLTPNAGRRYFSDEIELYLGKLWT